MKEGGESGKMELGLGLAQETVAGSALLGTAWLLGKLAPLGREPLQLLVGCKYVPTNLPRGNIRNHCCRIFEGTDQLLMVYSSLESMLNCNKHIICFGLNFFPTIQGRKIFLNNI